MPGNRFSLAIEVSRKIDGITFSRQLLKLINHFNLVGQYLVIGLPSLFRIDAHVEHQISAGLLLSVPRLLSRRHLAGLGRLLSTLLGIDLLFRSANGQVTNVADAGPDHILLTEILVNGLGLGRRLNDHQRFTHNTP